MVVVAAVVSVFGAGCGDGASDGRRVEADTGAEAEPPDPEGVPGARTVVGDGDAELVVEPLPQGWRLGEQMVHGPMAPGVDDYEIVQEFVGPDGDREQYVDGEGPSPQWVTISAGYYPQLPPELAGGGEPGAFMTDDGGFEIVRSLIVDGLAAQVLIEADREVAAQAEFDRDTVDRMRETGLLEEQSAVAFVDGHWAFSVVGSRGLDVDTLIAFAEAVALR